MHIYCGHEEPGQSAMRSRISAAYVETASFERRIVSRNRTARCTPVDRFQSFVKHRPRIAPIMVSQGISVVRAFIGRFCELVLRMQKGRKFFFLGVDRSRNLKILYV